MKVKLSVNINKIATLRNSRGGNIPDLLYFADLVLRAGAQGITVHPREDERHIRKDDVFSLKEFIDSYNYKNNTKIEYNMEGEPSPRFLDLLLHTRPDQATLVPVTPGEITSDHGFDFKKDLSILQEYSKVLKKEKSALPFLWKPISKTLNSSLLPEPTVWNFIPALLRINSIVLPKSDKNVSNSHTSLPRRSFWIKKWESMRVTIWIITI